MADRIVVTRRPPGDALGHLAEAGDVRLWEEDRAMPRTTLLEWVSDADGLYCMLTDDVDQELIDVALDLRVVSTMSVGVDHVDLDACRERRIPVGHTPDVLTDTTADTAFALLLGAARRLSEGIDHVREGRWGPWEPDLLLGRDVHHSTLGIVGLGRIGSAVARRAKGFGMRVLYHTRTRRPETEAALDVEYRDLPDLLAGADHVVLTLPLTHETHHLIDADALERMRPTATLVNVSRGPLVDTDALVAALASGAIAAAGLDVTDPEPIPSDHPLLDLANCVVIPHLGSSTVRTREAMARLAADNLVAGLAGRPLPARAG